VKIIDAPKERAPLNTKEWVAKVEPVETNILIFTLAPNYSEKVLIEKLNKKHIH
jgi:threonine aldolase